MKFQLSRIFPLLLVLLFMTACRQDIEKISMDEKVSESLSETQNISSIPNPFLEKGWPGDLAPAELPEYTSGTVTASAMDSEGVLTIKVTDTNKPDLDVYLGKLQSAGWIVTSDHTEAEAVLGLCSVTFALQGADDTVLQIDVYIEEAGSWPADEIPPDVPEPGKGVLVGTVEILSSVENMWYFNYTYDGIDEAAAEAYMNSLTEKGWSGDAYQMYKSFEWKGKYYEATIEIYEMVETRTTFTCNFYLSASEPASEDLAKQPAGTDASVLGSWMLGMLSGGQFSTDTGKYEGGASGMGQIYTFKPDGTYTALVIFGDTLWFTGNYSAEDDVLTLTGRTVEESQDGGNSWGAPETLPDASAHFVLGADDKGTYLLLGEEGATPPLEDKKNAMIYRLKD